MKLRNLFTKTEYAVCYRFCDKDILDDTDSEFKVLMPTKNQWYADPFVFIHDEEIYVFMEIMQNDKGYAGLGYSKLVDGKLTPPKTVIDYGMHLSFPFIFRYNDNIYMIPESRAEKEIKLYRCTDFPEKWEEIYSMHDERALYDSVIFEENGKRYLFTSEEDLNILYGSFLYLLELEADTLEPKILSDKRINADNTHSRQAGKMIRKDGRLIRAAQDCSKNEYGRALEFWEIDNLDSGNYSEHLLRHIDPEEIRTDIHLLGKAGVHTYNREENFDVVDLRLCRFSFSSTLKKIKIVFGIIISKIKK